jgi:hypothetical protein
MADQSVSDDVAAAATPAPVDTSNTLAASAVTGGAGIGGLLPPPGETTSEGVSISDTATTAEPTDVDVAVGVDDQAAVGAGTDTDAVPIPDEFDGVDTPTDTDDQIGVQQQPEPLIEIGVTATVGQEQRQGLRLGQLLRADQRLREIQATRTRTDTRQRVREDELQELELETLQLLDTDTRTKELTRQQVVREVPGLPARPRRPREDEDELEPTDLPELGADTTGTSGGTADDQLAPGWLAQTFTTIATEGRDPDATAAPSQATLEDQPLGVRLSGELPTQAQVSGDEATQERIDDVVDLFSFGGDR